MPLGSVSSGAFFRMSAVATRHLEKQLARETKRPQQFLYAFERSGFLQPLVNRLMGRILRLHIFDIDPFDRLGSLSAKYRACGKAKDAGEGGDA